MSHYGKILRGCLAVASFSLATGFAHLASASDPLPGDDIQLPANVNIGLAYDIFSDAGQLNAVRGSNTTHDVHISTDVVVLRYVRSFKIDGYVAGVQAYLPYVGFLGSQHAGLDTPFGPARANLAANSGFAQPNFGAFFWPYADTNSGTFVNVGGWISPPISSFNKNDSLNAGVDSSQYEFEAGFRTTLAGAPKTSNLALEIWATTYVYGNNNKSAAVTPTVTFNNIPGFAAPGSAFAATYREQPSQELRFYLPYTVAPAVAGVITPGLYQSFGGKQTYNIHGGPTVDSGNRTDETQLRLIGSMFLSPTTQVMLAGYYDVAAHGGPLNRTLLLRVAAFF